MLVSTTDYWDGGYDKEAKKEMEYRKEFKREEYRTSRDRERDFNDKQSCISSAASSNVSDNTLQTTNTSIFPHTASYVSSVYSKSNFGDVPLAKDASNANLFEQMERLNLLAKYNGVNLYDRSRLIQEHGEDFVIIENGFVTLKPKLNLPIPPGKFARWFQAVDPNATIRDDIKMARGVLRKDRFQHPSQLDNYLGIKALEEARRKATKDELAHADKDQQYRVKRVRNKLKHWNAMYAQLHDAIASVDVSNYTMREKVAHVDQICSIYIGRAERAIDCFYAEAAAHFMLDMVVSLQKKVADARAINQSYQSILDEARAIV